MQSRAVFYFSISVDIFETGRRALALFIFYKSKSKHSAPMRSDFMFICAAVMYTGTTDKDISRVKQCSIPCVD